MTEEGTRTEGNHHSCDYLEQTQYYTEIMRHLKQLQHTNMKSLMGTTTRGEFSGGGGREKRRRCTNFRKPELDMKYESN